MLDAPALNTAAHPAAWPLTRQPTQPTPPACWGTSGALVAELDELLNGSGFPGLDVLLLSAPEAEALAFAFAAQGGACGDEAATDQHDAEEAGMEDAWAPLTACDAGVKRGGKGAPLLMTQLRDVQTLSLREAAEQLGVGTTQFKLQCRRLGVKRWPHRKLKSLDGLIESCREAQTRMGSAALKTQLGDWVHILVNVQDDCLRSPDATFSMPPYVDRIKQWDVKQRYHARLREERGDVGGAAAINTVPPLPPTEELTPSERSRRRAPGPGAQDAL